MTHHRLANGVRVLVLPMPHLRSACVSVYVGHGSAAESRRNNGIGHLLEHMVFKGTTSRDARAINVDAERLGAEFNAHTDRDHTAFHLRGLAEHVQPFVAMLADLVLAPSIPADELERERQVLLQELTEDEEDPLSQAFQLFDRASWGLHSAALPVIGQRRTLEHVQRDEVLAWHRAHFVAPAMVLAVAGPVDPQAVVSWADSAFAGALADPPPPAPSLPTWRGGVKARHLAGHSQAHVVLGWPAPTMQADDPAPALAAALFGEGMSSPLMHELRERRGLFYYAACSADQYATQGQWSIEASTAADRRDEFLREALALVRRQAQGVDADDLMRGRNLMQVRLLRDGERPTRALEDAALDLLFLGRVRSLDERLDRLSALRAQDLEATFAGLLAQPVAVGATGHLGRAARQQIEDVLAQA
ncbi:MAG: M16 family metallopeptidase [Rubrivivax sp.]|nr:insulinase family protein [Rubrivivax sp.]